MSVITGSAFDPISLMQSLSDVSEGSTAAPVHLWNPPFCGDIDLEIRSDGLWFYMGSPIARPGLVRLFAKVLKKEGEKYYLVTPHEKVGIRVQDAPFVVSSVSTEADKKPCEQALVFTTSLGERVVLGPDHPLKVKNSGSDSPRPYLHVRDELYGVLARPVYYELIELARLRVEADHEVYYLLSQGAEFELGRVACSAD